MAEDETAQPTDEPTKEPDKKSNTKLGCAILAVLGVVILLAFGVCVTVIDNAEQAKTPDEKFNEQYSRYITGLVQDDYTLSTLVSRCVRLRSLHSLIAEGANASAEEIADVTESVNACSGANIPGFLEWRRLAVADKQAMANRYGLPCGRDCR